MDAGMTERESVAGLLDAPVLGSQPAAEGGTLIVLGSGPDDVRERVAPVLHAVSARTVWLGEAGAGQRLKLVANACVLALVERLAETFVLAEGLGVRSGRPARTDR